MEDLANHYGTVVVPARPGKPRDKSAVENHVKIIYTQVFARLRNRRFFDLESLNEAIAACIGRLNQKRMQNRSYCRQERFISNERHLLGELPTERFQLRYYAELKVADNGHIFLKRDRHSYSVPHIYRGVKAQVIYTEHMVWYISTSVANRWLCTGGAWPRTVTVPSLTTWSPPIGSTADVALIIISTGPPEYPPTLKILSVRYSTRAGDTPNNFTEPVTDCSACSAPMAE